MKGSLLLKKLTDAVPNSETWSTGEPYGANRLFNCDRDYKKILYCVTPTNEVVTYARNNYDLIISHHPFRVDYPQIILHTALDCCVGGLNDQWRDFLEIKDPKHFDKNLGWYGKIEPMTLGELTAKIERFIGRKIMGRSYSKVDVIKSVVVCTGYGGLVNELAIKCDADCYIIGQDVNKDEDFRAVIETGHTLSEQCGINTIRDILTGCNLQIDLAPINIDVFGQEVV